MQTNTSTFERLAIGTLFAALALLTESCKERGCTSDAECGPDEICFKTAAVEGECSRSCRVSSDCPPSFECSDSRCLPTDDPGPGFADASVSMDASVAGPFFLASDQIPSGGTFPEDETCLGADVQPELHWGNAPPDTLFYSIALLRQHVVYWFADGIPAGVRQLPINSSGTWTMPHGSSQSAPFCDLVKPGGRGQYCGPCPGPGQRSSYTFRIYARNAGTKQLLSQADLTSLDGLLMGQFSATAELTAEAVGR